MHLEEAFVADVLVFSHMNAMAGSIRGGKTTSMNQNTSIATLFVKTALSRESPAALQSLFEAWREVCWCLAFSHDHLHILQ